MQLPPSPLAENRVITTVNGEYPSYTLSSATPPQLITFDNTEGKITPSLIPDTSVGILVPQTPSAISNPAISQK